MCICGTDRDRVDEFTWMGNTRMRLWGDARSDLCLARLGGNSLLTRVFGLRD